jgi:hypothetical protein
MYGTEISHMWKSIYLMEEVCMIADRKSPITEISLLLLVILLIVITGSHYLTCRRLGY